MELLRPLWEKSCDDGAGITAEYYGVYAIKRPDFVEKAKEYCGKRVVGIEETTQDNIADIISRGISDGMSQARLKESIQEEMGSKATAARAKLIARQETMTALATGQFDMMKAAGATTKTWHHRDQKNPRDGKNGKANHVKLNNETVGIDEKFSNGLRYPRDPEEGSRPEEVINCRCYLTYGGWGVQDSHASSNPSGNINISPDGQVSQTDWINSLTEDEKEALHANTGPDNRGIQKMLRGEIQGNDEIKKWAANVESALEKATLSSDLQVKRGSNIYALIGLMDLPEEMTYEDVVDAVKTTPAQFIGKVISDDAFLSTSLLSGRSFKGVARYSINLKKGTHAAYVSNFADGLDDEIVKEVLVQRKTKFKVTNINLGVDDFMGYDIIQVSMETVAE